MIDLCGTHCQSGVAHLFSDNGGVRRWAEFEQKSQCGPTGEHLYTFSTNTNCESICGVVLCATRQHDDCVDPRQQQHDDKLMDQETHVVVLRRDHFGHVETHVVVLCPTGND